MLRQIPFFILRKQSICDRLKMHLHGTFKENVLDLLHQEY